MNIERLTAIAEWLEAGAPHTNGVETFNMASVEIPGTCGAICCIAGAANQWWSPLKNEPDKDGGMLNAFHRARDLLGLKDWQMHSLFAPGDAQDEDGEDIFPDINHYKIDAPWAARCIRNLIATGEVDWEGTR